jgi:hypothetical protein
MEDMEMSPKDETAPESARTEPAPPRSVRADQKTLYFALVALQKEHMRLLTTGDVRWMSTMGMADFLLDRLEEWRIDTPPAESPECHFCRAFDKTKTQAVGICDRTALPVCASHAQDCLLDHTWKPLEPPEARVIRYERTLRAIAESKLTGIDYADWVQAACDDALQGLWPECPECGTAVHEGPCVSAAAPSDPTQPKEDLK